MAMGLMVEFLRGDEAILATKGDTLIAAPRSASAAFKVIGLPLGRVSLQAPDGRLVTVTGLGENGRVSLERVKKQGDDSQTFQWTEMPRGDVLFLSLASHRHLCLAEDGSVRADASGAQADRMNGASFTWREVKD